MGFFSDLKNDLSQAVNEMLPDEEQIKTEDSGSIDDTLENLLKDIDSLVAEEEGEQVADLEKIAEEETVPVPEDTAGETAASDSMPQEVVTEEPVPEVTQAEAVTETENTMADDMAAILDQLLEKTVDIQEDAPATVEIKPEEPAEEAAIEKEVRNEETVAMDMNRVASDETSVITAGMVITGDISTEGSIDIVGTVNGNVSALGKVNITGHINGNTKAAEVYADSAKINGEVNSEGAVKVGASSVIIGNISATSAAIAGAVKGDIDVKGPVILDASAIVMGNIKSKSVQINNGAVIEGMCSQCYADVSPTSFFDDYKPEGRKAKNK